MNAVETLPEAPTKVRTCGKCGLVLTVKHCRPCKTKYAAAYRAAHPEKQKAADVKYRTNNREKANAASLRWKRSAPERPCYKCGTLFTGPAGYCQPCDKIYHAAWHQVSKTKNKPSNANPETRLKNKRLAEQRRRARKRLVDDEVSIDIVAKLLTLQKGCCACCKSEFKGTKYELDHIDSLAKGGRHADGNLQLLCMPCNRAKADKDPIAFMQQRGFLL